MAEVVHPRKLDRTKPFGECLGAITNDVHFLQAGYGFNSQGECVQVTPAAPDYEAWCAHREAKAAGGDGGEGTDPQSPLEPAQTQPVAPEQAAPADPNAPQPFSGLTWGGQQQPAPPAETAPGEAVAPSPCAPTALDPETGGPADQDSVDGGAIDTEGPIDPEMPWNELQATMKARNLPLPKNKADAKRILEEAGLTA